MTQVTVDHAELPINYAVTCQTCAVVVWQGSHLVEDDGTELLNAYADVACPREDCSHKTPPAVPG